MKRNKKLVIYGADISSCHPLPFAESIKAGFPSPAQDYIELSIDLNKELIKHPASTFIGKVDGDSMIEAGIHHGNILIIDKIAPPLHGDMVVCFIDGEFTLKYIDLDEKENGIIWLIPANEKYQPIKVTEENNFIVWGKVIKIISDPPKRRKG